MAVQWGAITNWKKIPSLCRVQEQEQEVYEVERDPPSG
jgi:hypothetical protein